MAYCAVALVKYDYYAMNFAAIRLLRCLSVLRRRQQLPGVTVMVGAVVALVGSAYFT
jgi:hypothetical protein